MNPLIRSESLWSNPSQWLDGPAGNKVFNTWAFWRTFYIQTTTVGSHLKSTLTETPQMVTEFLSDPRSPLNNPSTIREAHGICKPWDFQDRTQSCPFLISWYPRVSHIKCSSTLSDTSHSSTTGRNLLSPGSQCSWFRDCSLLSWMPNAHCKQTRVWRSQRTQSLVTVNQTSLDNCGTGTWRLLPHLAY
jgi:hypothetical protein